MILKINFKINNSQKTVNKTLNWCFTIEMLNHKNSLRPESFCKGHFCEHDKFIVQQC